MLTEEDFAQLQEKLTVLNTELEAKNIELENFKKSKNNEENKEENKITNDITTTIIELQNKVEAIQSFINTKPPEELENKSRPSFFNWLLG